MNQLPKSKSRILAILTAITLLVSTLSPTFLSTMKEVQAAGLTLKNPSTDANGVTTWDTVYFGSYPQSDATGVTKEPIRWRVLQVTGDDVFLLADKNLDAQPYNTEYVDVTWETCTMRNWLNTTFLTTAFTASQQSVIKTTTVVNANNPDDGTAGGNDTSDKVYLLSIAEASNTNYGFSSTFNNDSDTRVARNTAYTASKNSWMNSEGSANWWWLRSPGSRSDYAANVYYYGNGYYVGNYVGNDSLAVRPALHITLSSLTPSNYGGTITSAGGDSGTTPPNPDVEPTPNPDDKPNQDNSQTPTKVQPTALTMNKNTTTIGVGKTEILTTTLTPSNAITTITWTTSDSKIATVENGKVTGKKVGAASITATTVNGKKAICNVTVNNPATSISISHKKLTLAKKRTFTLAVTMKPADTTDKITWTSSKPKNVSVGKTSGKVTALKAGTSATITATSTSGKKATCKVNVPKKEVKAKSIILNKKTATLKVGKTLKLKATLTPKETTDNVFYTSSNKKVAKVSNTGVITALKKGTAFITAKTTSGKKVKVKITVKK